MQVYLVFFLFTDLCNLRVKKIKLSSILVISFLRHQGLAYRSKICIKSLPFLLKQAVFFTKPFCLRQTEYVVDVSVALK